MVAIVVTDRHLVLQRLKKSKQLEADGPPLRLAAADIAATSSPTRRSPSSRRSRSPCGCGPPTARS